MSLRPDPTDPADMPPEVRLDEVASILAGCRRLPGAEVRRVPDRKQLEGHGRALRPGTGRSDRRLPNPEEE